MILAVIITILMVILIQLLFLKLTSPILRKVVDEAINVSCYVDTYHYGKSEYDRVQIGQDRYYKILFGEKESSYKRSLTDYVFWVFYTQIFDKLLNCIPRDVSKHHNRCLSEGEERGTCKFLDNYQNTLEEKYTEYCTEQEKQNRMDRFNCECESENN